MALLSVQELRVHYFTKRGIVRAVDGIAFDLEEGENLGLVGESGYGKSTIAKSLPIDLPEGRRFRPRCSQASEICLRLELELKDRGEGRKVACHL